MNVERTCALVFVLVGTAACADILGFERGVPTGEGAAAGSIGAGGTGGHAGGEGGTAGASALSCPSATSGPALVLIPSPSPPRYCIDATEVTRAQYLAFVEAGVAISAQPAECSANADYAPLQQGLCVDNQTWPPTAGNDGFPVICVDWCDARAFCEWAGKRLCRSDPSAFTTLDTSEWFNACSRGGERVYPYGNQYDPEACVGFDQADGMLGEAGSLSTCEGGYDGLFDLSGNVWEWIDACDGQTGPNDGCMSPGGAAYATYDFLTCETGGGFPRDELHHAVGFRCCADATTI